MAVYQMPVQVAAAVETGQVCLQHTRVKKKKSKDIPVTSHGGP
jgi:hypothetical protein